MFLHEPKKAAHTIKKSPYLGQFMFAIIVFILLNSINVYSQEPISPIPLNIITDVNKVALGKKLFFDKSLSVDDTISCASCHDLAMKYGTDLTSVSMGVKGQFGERNSPTVFNSTYNFLQFWDGSAKDLAHQAASPVINPVEMGMESWSDAIEKLSKINDYNHFFEAAYGDSKVTEQRVTDSIAEFEKTLTTPNSLFDKYLRGNKEALNSEQIRGYKLFKSYGCVSCHQGVNVGGNMFQKFGVLKDINLNKNNLNKDLGRFNVTGNEWDKRVFKVPSLRLAVKTPPYFHDGSVATIEEAVDIMIEFQLGREVPIKDRQSIIAFLGTLVGDIPEGVK